MHLVAEERVGFELSATARLHPLARVPRLDTFPGRLGGHGGSLPRGRKTAMARVRYNIGDAGRGPFSLVTYGRTNGAIRSAEFNRLKARTEGTHRTASKGPMGGGAAECR